MLTARQENELALRLLDPNNEDIVGSLNRTVGITSATALGRDISSELRLLLSKTVTVVEEWEPCDLEVFVDPISDSRRAKQSLFVRVHPTGFTISTDNVGRSNGSCQPLQLLVASCYFCAAILGALLGINCGIVPENRQIEVDFQTVGIPTSLFNQRVEISGALIGAGAIGTAFISALSRLDPIGDLSIVDFKNVSSGNLNRCMYFCKDDVGKPKAEVLAKAASKDLRKLRLSPYIGSFEEYVSTLRCGRVHLVFSAVDSRRVRRKIQSQMPFEVFDASTTEASEIIIHSNRYPRTGACLSCIYKHVAEETGRERDIANALGVSMSEVRAGLVTRSAAAHIIEKHPNFQISEIVGRNFDTLFKELCAAQANVSTEIPQVVAPFAFVSALAGALLAVDLLRARSRSDDLRSSNYMFLSPWEIPHRFSRLHRPREQNCEYCGDQSVRLIEAQFWADDESQQT